MIQNCLQNNATKTADVSPSDRLSAQLVVDGCGSLRGHSWVAVTSTRRRATALTTQS